jgi:putative heme iron utilization protein
MTTSTTNKPNWTIALGIPFLIFLSCLLITFSPKFTSNNELLSNGILLDLLITTPIVYFLAIRKSNVSKLTVIRVFIVAALFAGVILRSHANPVLQIIKTWISPVIEAFVIFIICKKFYVANKNAKGKNNNKIDFLLHSRSILFEILGNEKAANIVSSEIAVMYYAFFGVKSKSIDYKTKFTSYKENGLPIVLGVILSIFLIETSGVHLLLSLWSSTVAWILTALSFYTCIQLFAHIRALKARPIIINSNSFEVHNGLAGDAFIQLDNIEKIELSNKKPIGRESIKISLLKGLENHNIVVYLKKPIDVTTIFGIKKQTDTVLFFVDKPKEFITVISSLLTNKVSV